MSVTAQDIFSGMKENFNEDAAAGVSATIAYELSGDFGGVWTLRVQDGALQVDEGLPSGNVDATVRMDASDFVKVATGELNPMTAFMSGKIRISGDPMTAQKFQDYFRRP